MPETARTQNGSLSCATLKPGLVAYLTAEEAATFLEWLAGEVETGRLRIETEGPSGAPEVLCLTLDDRLRSRIIARQVGRRGRLTLSLDWEATTYGPLEIVVD